MKRGGDRGNQHTGAKGPIGPLPDAPEISNAQAAKMMNVSERSVRRARVASKIANMQREDNLKKGNRRPDPQICGSAVAQADAAKMLNVGLRTVQHAAANRSTKRTSPNC